jgi:hypothetical protein
MNCNDCCNDIYQCTCLPGGGNSERRAQSGPTPPNTSGLPSDKPQNTDVRATVGDQDKINVLFAMVEGLHAMIYGIYTINSGDFALKALGDGGSIHEYVHAMMLLLPERCYEQIQSGGEVAADKGEASHTEVSKPASANFAHGQFDSGAVHVCFDRDRECGQRPANWCANCPLLASHNQTSATAKAAVICSNCDTALPKGCGGIFKDDGPGCLLNGGSQVGKG